MNDIFFRPLEMFDLQGFLTVHSDWLYFALIVALFISIAGITLRKHFDQPYVKPLIIAVGFILAVAAFRNRHVLTLIFNGWGTLGYVLLLLIAAMIPYGLAKGFGLPTDKAAWLTYILMYIIASASFPELFAMLSDKGMALLNLALLILFVVAIWKVVRLNQKSMALPNISEIKDITNPKQRVPAPYADSEHNRHIHVKQTEAAEQAEERELHKEAIPYTLKDIKTLGDLEGAFSSILEILKKKEHDLKRTDREAIAKHLALVIRKEHLFFDKLQKLEGAFDKMNLLDHAALIQIRTRAKSATESDRKLMMAELGREKEKRVIYGTVKELGNKLKSSWNTFQIYLNSSIQALRRSSPLNEVVSDLNLGEKSLKNMKIIFLSLSDLEKRLITILKEERDLLMKEEKVA